MYSIWVLDSLGRIIHDLTDGFDYKGWDSLATYVAERTGATFDGGDLFALHNGDTNAIFSNKYEDINQDVFSVVVRPLNTFPAK